MSLFLLLIFLFIYYNKVISFITIFLLKGFYIYNYSNINVIKIKVY